MKGVLVNGYGISADAATDALIVKLKTHLSQKKMSRMGYAIIAKSSFE